MRVAEERALDLSVDVGTFVSCLEPAGLGCVLLCCFGRVDHCTPGHAAAARASVGLVGCRTGGEGTRVGHGLHGHALRP